MYLQKPKAALARTGGMLLLGTAGILALRRVRREEAELSGQVVLITGGSRGLGLQLAHEFARHDCRLVICARDDEELQRAEEQLRRSGATVFSLVCDVSDRQQVQRMVDVVHDRWGRIDVLVNNAGIMDVGALPSQTLEMFEQAMDVMYWGMIYPTLAVLPEMRARRQGRIVNITSIGGRVSVPHLLPYGGAKFAAVGFSEGLRAELAGTGVTVTTIVPGLMRTGSYLNAYFHGRRSGEFSWFSLGASLPLISIDSRRAVRQIVTAVRRGEAERTISLPAVFIARLHGLFPGFTADLLGLIGRIIQPPEDATKQARKRGWEVQQEMEPPRRTVMKGLTVLGRQAARELNGLTPRERVLDRQR